MFNVWYLPFVLNAKCILWEAGDTLRLTTREQTWLSKAHQFVALRTESVILEQESLLSRRYSIRDSGDYTLEIFFQVRVHLTIISWLGTKYSFRSVTHWPKCEWLWIIYNHGKQYKTKQHISNYSFTKIQEKEMSFLSSFMPYRHF